MRAPAAVILAASLLGACKTDRPPAPAAPPLEGPSAPTSAASPPTGLSLSPPSSGSTNMPTPPPPASSGDPTALANVARGDRDFAARLYGRVRGADGNLFFSPTSIRLALGMTYEGARGETRAQMGRVLAFDDTASSGFAALLTQWAARAAPPPAAATTDWERAAAERKRLVLRVANRLWGQQGKAFEPDFLARLRDDYGAPLETVDFHGATEPSRLRINAWVADSTEQKIRDLLAPGTVTPDTRLVVTNAVYFKANWASEFWEAGTRQESFTTASGAAVKAPLMHKVDSFRTAKITAGDVPCAALEMPYGAPGVAMIVLLPDARDGLPKLEAKLDGALLDTAMARLQQARVDLAFPRFRATSALQLGEVLSAMGMPAAFAADQADFSGMDGTREIFIGAVVHKAFVSVDEKGTEAAAATAVAMAGAGMPTEPPVPFHADHPFVYVIADTTNHTILFMGRVVDPTR
ncbi:MAG TPA: serpin family protein [Polyangiaceae bacterium]